MKFIVIIFVLILGNMASGQTLVDRNLNLELAEKDSAKSEVLEQSLNGFLLEAKSNAYTSRYVDPQHIKKYGCFSTSFRA